MNQARLKCLVASCCVAALAGCGPSLEDYAGTTPELMPERYFNGHLKSWGVIEDSGGVAGHRFTMEADASWHGEQGHQHEVLHFADGHTQIRDWAFRKIDAHHFIGTAPDVEGEALGESRGNALHWVYRIRVKSGGTERVVTFDDWLYLVDATHLVSQVSIRKWGLLVGRMTMFFEKTF